MKFSQILSYFFIFTFILLKKPSSEESEQYQAIYTPLYCTGIERTSTGLNISNWTFYPAGGSGSIIETLSVNGKRTGKIRTTVYKNGDLYGRGKWIGRTDSRIYNTLITVNYDAKKSFFSLSSQFNPDEYRLQGKCIQKK